MTPDTFVCAWTAALPDVPRQRGHGAFSVSESGKDAVVAYVRGQAEHHRKTTFQEEYRAFLERHRVAYDERYLWD